MLPPLEDCAVFPLPESSNLEFKRNHASCDIQKIYATICAILNGGGGHIIFGVEDGSRRIVGVTCDKSLDIFVLNIDNIYHTRMINYRDKTPIPIHAVKTEMVRAAGDKKLLVITLTAEKGEVYSFKDGSIWHRLNASNFKQTSLNRLYTKQEMNDILNDRLENERKAMKKSLYSEWASEKCVLVDRFRKLEGEFKEVLGSAKKTEEAVGELREMVFQVILQQKAAAEKEMATKAAAGGATGWRAWLCCLP